MSAESPRAWDDIEPDALAVLYREAEGEETGPRPLWTRERLAAGAPWLRDLDWSESRSTGTLRLRPSLRSVLTVLREDARWSGVLCFDEMRQVYAVDRGPPWGGRARAEWSMATDVTRLREWLDWAYGCGATGADVSAAVEMVARLRPVHPVRQWLSGLPEWDGTPRVREFGARYLGAEDGEYSRLVSRVLLVSLVRRALEPGCKHDLVVVLEGEQGIKKSTALQVLVGAAWYAQCTADIGSKDSQLAMHGKWLIEMPELAGMTRSEVERVKAHFSASSDYLRPPYGKDYVTLARSSVTVATTNDAEYLRDKTGNRRYLPLECTAIDIEGIRRDRVQLFSEAKAAAAAGVPHWLADAGEEALVRPITEEREHDDAIWDAVLETYLPDKTVTGVTTEYALLAVGICSDKHTHALAMTMGKTLRRLGWVPKLDRATRKRIYRPCARKG